MRHLLIALPLSFALGGAFANPHSAPTKTNTSHAPVAHEKGHWTYEGETGPNAWANLDPAFFACASGQQQSPINIETAYSQKLDYLQIEYKTTKLSLLNNGHTLQHNIDPGSFLSIGKDRYQLLQFHLHTPSEESIAGKRFAMDIHMVHKSEDGRLAVLTLLIEEGKKDNALFNTLWKSLPAENETRNFDKISFNPATLLPNKLNYWTFMGSLTTPPCTEGVRWLILKSPIQLSTKQVDRFRKLFPMNARPVQPLNQRVVLDTE